MEKSEIIETTLGDLIVVLTEEASQYVPNKKEIHNMVAFILAHLLNNSVAASRRCQYWQ